MEIFVGKLSLKQLKENSIKTTINVLRRFNVLTLIILVIKHLRYNSRFQWTTRLSIQGVVEI